MSREIDFFFGIDAVDAIRNPRFDRGVPSSIRGDIPGWTRYQDSERVLFDFISTIQMDGVRLQGPGSPRIRNTRTVSVVPGDEFWVHVRASNPVNNGTGVWVQWQDPAGNLVRSDRVITIPANRAGWAEYENVAIAPEGAARAVVDIIRLYSSQAEAEACLAGLSFRPRIVRPVTVGGLWDGSELEPWYFYGTVPLGGYVYSPWSARSTVVYRPTPPDSGSISVVSAWSTRSILLTAGGGSIGGTVTVRSEWGTDSVFLYNAELPDQGTVEVPSSWGTASIALVEPVDLGSVIPYDTDPSYYEQFPVADAAGWSDPDFFPFAVFFGRPDPTHVAQLKLAGINTFMGHEEPTPGSSLETATNEGIYILGFYSDTEAQANPMVVGWHLFDEWDMGEGRPAGTNGIDWLAAAEDAAAGGRALEDGRLVQANFGKGVLRTWWSTESWAGNEPLTVMHGQMQNVDLSGVDLYAYSAAGIWEAIDGAQNAPDWPDGTPVQRAYAYGWVADQIKRFQDPETPRPYWVFVETAKPFVYDDRSRTIELDQIEGAVWSAIIHGAKGISYFQHNNDPEVAGMYSIVENNAIRDKLAQINGEVTNVAAVINSPAIYNTTREVNGFTYYEFSFGNGTDTRVVPYDGDLYVIAGVGMGHVPGLKTFNLPDNLAIDGPVEVIGEGRNIAITDGRFVDDFPYEYTHHVYRIPLAEEE